MPGVVHAYRESQNHGLYQKAFSKLPFIKECPQNLDRRLMDLEFKFDRIMEAQRKERGDSLLFLKGGCIYDGDMEAQEAKVAMFPERKL